MSRVDIPRLKCDIASCGYETTDTREMGSFMGLYNDHMSGRDSWDLCRSCAKEFRDWTKGVSDENTD